MIEKKTFTPDRLSISKLRPYSIGIVASNKKLSSKTIDVTPVEELTMLDGELTANTVNLKATGKDANGRAYSSNVNTTVTIKADWLPMGSSNRFTAPDVRRGESVMIYQFGDADQYYWTTLKDDMKLRRLETVIYGFSGTSAEVDSFNPSNCYFLEVSTHRGAVTFHTSTANGEPYAYDVQINTKEGSVTITDDAGNKFLLDSKVDRLVMQNSTGSMVDVNRANVIIAGKDTVQIQTKAFNVVATNSVIEGSFHGTGSATIAGGIKTTNLEASTIKGTFVK